MSRVFHICFSGGLMPSKKSNVRNRDIYGEASFCSGLFTRPNLRTGDGSWPRIDKNPSAMMTHCVVGSSAPRDPFSLCLHRRRRTEKINPGRRTKRQMSNVPEIQIKPTDGTSVSRKVRTECRQADCFPSRSKRLVSAEIPRLNFTNPLHQASTAKTSFRDRPYTYYSFGGKNAI